MENYQHFILSNRKVKQQPDGKSYFLLDSDIAPDLPLYYVLYDIAPDGLTDKSPITAPVTAVGDGSAFVAQVLAEAKNLPAGSRNITFYIHGFHHIFEKSYKLDLFAALEKAYCSTPNRLVGKFIFFSWPATDSRNVVDDRAHAQGMMLYRNNKKMFETLTDALAKIGVSFNLMAHSFGHRILNGFLSEAGTGKKLFDQVFLFAADIPHAAMDTTLPGIKLRNRKNSDFDGDTPADDKERLYDLTKLQHIAGETHCFYCRYDRMLMASTDQELKRIEDENNQLVNGFLCLGSLGNRTIKPFGNVYFYDVLDWLKSEQVYGQMLDAHLHILQQMDYILDHLDLSKSDQHLFVIDGTERTEWIHVHQYLFQSAAVVRKVGELLTTAPGTKVLA